MIPSSVSTTRQRLLVIGNGMAGLKFLEEITALAPGSFEITAVGEEPEAAYNRVLLSPLLAGEIVASDLHMKPRQWYGDHNIALHTGSPVVSLDTSLKSATLANGEVLAFDTCVFATGSEPIRLAVPGGDLKGVEVFRTLSDISRLASAGNSSQPVVVIGGGLLGIEAAYGLRRAGAQVTLIHIMDRLMERQLDTEAAARVKAAVEAKGIAVHLGAETAGIVGAGSVEKIVLKNGREIPACLVVMSVGIKPKTSLAMLAKLNCRCGIVVDNRMETSAPGIYAIGECAEHNSAVYGLVEPAYEQARVAARALARLDANYNGTVLATNLKVSGVPVFSAGDFEGAGAEHIIWRDGAYGHYRKFVVRNNQLAGVVLAGDTTDALWYRDLIRSGAPIGAFRSTLAFGPAYAEAA